MARESKAQFAARIAQDNERAAVIPEGSVVEDELFGKMVLGKNLGPNENSQGWDLYEVKHSGFVHNWSSALVAVSFGKQEVEG